MDYKISVIIPVYNVENYLENTLGSIISQSIGFENLEIILIDDKSTDNSAKIIKNYMKKYDNIKGIFLEEGSGFPGKPRNIGLNYVTSDYVMFLDSDDYLEKNACEILYNVVQEENADIVSGSFTKKDEDGTEIFNYGGWVSTLTDPNEDYSIRLEKTKEMLDNSNFRFVVTNIKNNGHILGNSNVWAKIFRTNLIKDNNILFPEDIVAQDSVFLLESIFNANKIVFIKDVLVRYNNQRVDINDKSISHIKSNKNLFGRIKAYQLMYNLSIRFGYESLFYKYVLGHKLIYWFKSYLLESYISTFEIECIFKKYYELFNKCYIHNKKLPNSINNIFRDISNRNFHEAALEVSRLQTSSNITVLNDVMVSIIIPVYNNEKFLYKCLDSVINQSIENIEIICIDDGSTDDSFKILKEYESKDNRVKIISQLNSGAAIARNKGIELAKGQFILFLDSDDWLELNALEKLLNNAISNDSELVLFNAVEHKEGGTLKNRIYMEVNSSEDYNNFTFNYKFNKKFVMNGYLVIWSKFYKTSFLTENNLTFTNHPIFNDIQFHIKSMLLANKISYCPDILYNYLRINQPSLQNNIGLTKKSFIIIKIIDEIEDYLKKNNFYEDLELNFLRFKITELEVRLHKVANDYKNELFILIKNEFKSMDINTDKLQKLPFKNYKFYIDVLTYDSFFEYIYYQDVEFNNENNDFSNLLNNQNNLIVDLQNNLSSLKHENLLLNQFLMDILKDNFLIQAINKIYKLNLFDEEFYRNTYNYQDNLNPLIHYIYEGYKYGWNPCSKFNTSFYRLVNDNIRKTNMNPLIYFVMNGLDEGIIRINNKIHQHKCIDKKKLDNKINKFSEWGVKTVKRKQKVIISLTSFPDRIHDIHYCIYSLLNQKFYPDEVILWLAKDQFPNKYADLTKNLLKLLNNGLTIRWCDDIRSYKKLIPVLKENPNDIIITVDDDIYYPDFWLSVLMDNYYKNPNTIMCYRSRKISFDENNKINKYFNWKLSEKEQSPSYLNFFTGAGGVLYPPNSLNETVFDEELFTKLCPFADDVWFWGMAVLNHTKIKLVGGEMKDLIYINPSREIRLFDEKTLYAQNQKGKNDYQIQKLLKYFPNILKIIFNEEKL